MAKRITTISLAIAVLALFGFVAWGTETLDAKRTADDYTQQHKQGLSYTWSVTSMAAYEGVRVTSGWHAGTN